MIYSVSMQPVRGTDALEHGNFRGECRWERLVARALLDGGCRVGSHNAPWEKPDSPHWSGSADSFADCVSIVHSGPLSAGYLPGAKAYIFNFFNGPDAPAQAEIRECVRANGKKWVATTYNFRCLNAFSPLARAGLEDCIRWLPTPAVPACDFAADPFNNTVLLWSVRYVRQLLTSEAKFCDGLLDWIRGWMVARPELTFEVLGGDDASPGETEAAIWAIPGFARAFGDLRHRVTIHGPLHWFEVQDVFKRTKLVVSPPARFGGPPLEAGALGIPTVGLNRESSFHGSNGRPAFLEYMGVEGSTFGLDDALIPKLDRLMFDGDHYRRAGTAYRQYTHDWYTFAAFRRELAHLENERGWW